MSEYRIYIDEELLCKTDWPPMAQAAWHRASRDRDAAQHGGEAVIIKDGQELARVQSRTGVGHPWPDRDTNVSDMHDVVKTLMTMLRHAGIDAVALAQSCSETGLPMTRARIDALRGSTPGKRTAACEAEIVCLLSAAIPLLKNESQKKTGNEFKTALEANGWDITETNSGMHCASPSGGVFVYNGLQAVRYGTWHDVGKCAEVPLPNLELLSKA
jgi:hypothetical protein